jgi:SAM-dependent methyltransferase
MSDKPAVPYDPAFYAQTRAGSRQSAAVIVPIVMELFRPQSVVDVGCGTGDWLRCFKAAGAGDLTGLDGQWVAPTDGPFAFVTVDLERPFSLPKRCDVALCLEVAEHLEPTAAEHLITSLVHLSSIVLFSAAIPHQGGRNHKNEQWPEYWAELFSRHAFSPVDCIRPLIWNDRSVDWWYAQNVLVYMSEAALRGCPDLRACADRTDRSRLSMVHPRGYLHKIAAIADARVTPDPERLPAGTLLSVAPTVLGKALRRKLRRKGRT